jgi:hypothetical protein
VSPSLARLEAQLRAFWPHYIAHHAHPANRALHYAADCVVVGGFLACVVLREAWPAIAGSGAGLALVVAGHLLVEKNAPLVFRHPLLATLCNVRMAWLAVQRPLRLTPRGRAAPLFERWIVARSESGSSGRRGSFRQR